MVINIQFKKLWPALDCNTAICSYSQTIFTQLGKKLQYYNVEKKTFDDDADSEQKICCAIMLLTKG